MSTRRSVKHKYLKTKQALGRTIQQLLDINRRRKVLSELDTEQIEQFDEKIKVLNATAENQAHVLRLYEAQIKAGQASAKSA